MLLDLVDVFGSGPLSGNPLAVVRGGEELDAAGMLRLTRWLGFSETTFLLPPTDPEADYKVRIFYPAGELPFAGHPTLGTAHAWLAAGGTPKAPGRMVQECGIGLVEVRQEGDRLWRRFMPATGLPGACFIWRRPKRCSRPNLYPARLSRPMSRCSALARRAVRPSGKCAPSSPTRPGACARTR